jgi:nitrogen regulatory protein PII
MANKLVILITTHIDKGLAIAEAWEAAGAAGVTIIESFGLHRLREKSRSIELPLFVSLAQVMREIEETNHTLLSVVDESLVDALITAATQVLGRDLNQPDTGIVFVLDVDRVIGIRPGRKD